MQNTMLPVFSKALRSSSRRIRVLAMYLVNLHTDTHYLHISCIRSAERKVLIEVFSAVLNPSYQLAFQPQDHLSSIHSCTNIFTPITPIYNAVIFSIGHSDPSMALFSRASILRSVSNSRQKPPILDTC